MKRSNTVKTSLFPPSGQNGVAAVADSNCGQRYKTFSTVRLFCNVRVFDSLSLSWWTIGYALVKHEPILVKTITNKFTHSFCKLDHFL
jgi:hypothetical protein